VTFRDPRDVFLGRVVPGHTFADVGGLWGTVNEKVSVAHALGASELTMIDLAPEDGVLWQKFRERIEAFGVPDCRRIRRTVTDVSSVLGLGFDVVHCSGVLYHHPNPLGFLAALRALTARHLVLTSVVVPPLVLNEHGELRLPPCGVVFLPALSDEERAVLGHYYRESSGAVGAGLSMPYEYNVLDLEPWWWLPTSDALRCMCRATGFEVRDAAHFWGGNALALLLDVEHASDG
jgi:hypothetical protein